MSKLNQIQELAERVDEIDCMLKCAVYALQGFSGTQKNRTLMTQMDADGKLMRAILIVRRAELADELRKALKNIEIAAYAEPKP